jgi:hypothetical protein
MPDPLEFPLEVGVTTLSPTYGASVPRHPSRYRIRTQRYEVTLVADGNSTVLGRCTVAKTGAQSFKVRLGFPLTFPPEDCRFWGAFTVGEDGVATLESVYLVVRGH